MSNNQVWRVVGLFSIFLPPQREGLAKGVLEILLVRILSTWGGSQAKLRNTGFGCVMRESDGSSKPVKSMEGTELRYQGQTG